MIAMAELKQLMLSETILALQRERVGDWGRGMGGGKDLKNGTEREAPITWVSE
jgi:hypothetical protein